MIKTKGALFDEKVGMGMRGSGGLSSVSLFAIHDPKELLIERNWHMC